MERNSNSKTNTSDANVRDVIRALNIPATEWQIGRTKVFLRSAVHEPLEDARKQVLHSKATIVQSAWRRYLARRSYVHRRKAALCIQHAYIGWKLRIAFLRRRRAAIVIQSHLRGVFAREVAAALREMRRVDEEMRKRERLEAERRDREEERKKRESLISDQQAEEERRAIEECERLVEKWWCVVERGRDRGKRSVGRSIIFLTIIVQIYQHHVYYSHPRHQSPIYKPYIVTVHLRIFESSTCFNGLHETSSNLFCTV